MKLLTIFTGGTIGSSIENGYINTNTDNMQKLLKTVTDDTLSFEICNPYTILSENLNGKYILMLINTVKNAIKKGIYDGIIVTHGTDTLQYTSAILGYVFYNSPVPIVLVSSNYILDDPRANGPLNLSNAISFIKRYKSTGMTDTKLGSVFVSYGNTDPLGRVFGYIHRATRVLPHIPYSDHIFSINNTFYGQFISEGSFVLNSTDTASVQSSNDTVVELPKEINLNQTSPVMYIKEMPGIIYPDIPENIKCIIMEAYHSGTLCTSDDSSNGLWEFTSKATENNIPIFLSGMPDGLSYESTSVFSSLNIKILPPASPIAMYMKAWLILDNNMDMELIFKPFADEFV